MKESNTPNIDFLKDRVTKLKTLLDDPQPGLFTWVKMYGEIVRELMDFWTDK